MKYYKIEGVIEIPDNIDLDYISDMLTDNLDEVNGFFGGGIKEVDSEGNDIINNQKTK